MTQSPLLHFLLLNCLCPPTISTIFVPPTISTIFAPAHLFNNLGNLPQLNNWAWLSGEKLERAQNNVPLNFKNNVTFIIQVVPKENLMYSFFAESYIVYSLIIILLSLLDPCCSRRCLSNIFQRNLTFTET